MWAVQAREPLSLAESLFGRAARAGGLANAYKGSLYKADARQRGLLFNEEESPLLGAYIARAEETERELSNKIISPKGTIHFDT